MSRKISIDFQQKNLNRLLVEKSLQTVSRKISIDCQQKNLNRLVVEKPLQTLMSRKISVYFLQRNRYRLLVEKPLLTVSRKTSIDSFLYMKFTYTLGFCFRFFLGGVGPRQKKTRIMFISDWNIPTYFRTQPVRNLVGNNIGLFEPSSYMFWQTNCFHLVLFKIRVYI